MIRPAGFTSSPIASLSFCMVDRTDELQGTLSAAATIGVFSWPELATTHWYAKALWYSSLVLAIFSLIGLSQSRLTEAVSCIEEREASDEEKRAALRAFVNPDDTSMDDDGESPMSWYTRNMVFVWQWTLMVMVWSWVTFLMALLLHIVKPFLPTQNPETADRNVGVSKEPALVQVADEQTCRSRSFSWLY